MTRFILACAALAALVWTSAPAAAAQACREAVDRLAAQHGLQPDLPQAPPASGSTGPSRTDAGPTLSDKLAQTGGVIAPPAGGRTVVIDPPGREASKMPTNPQVAPQTTPGTPSPQPQADAAQRQRAETSLQAARSAAERGDDAVCMERLRDAQEALAGAEDATRAKPQ